MYVSTWNLTVGGYTTSLWPLWYLSPTVDIFDSASYALLGKKRLKNFLFKK